MQLTYLPNKIHTLSTIITSILIVILLSLSTRAYAAPINVGVISSAPFAVKTQNKYRGISIALWKEIAQDTNLDYRFIALGKDVNTGFRALQNKKIDVLIGPIIVTAANITKASFSRPYFINRMALVTKKKPHNLWQTMRHIAADVIVSILIAYAFLLLVFTGIFYHLARRTHKNTASSRRPTLSRTLWHTIATLFSLNFIRTPKTTYERIVGSFWLLFSLCFIALFSATLTSSLTISSSNLSLNNQTAPTTLAYKKLAVIRGSYAAYLANKVGATTIVTADFKNALQLLKENKVEGILENYVTLQYQYKQHRIPNTHLEMLTDGTGEIAFAFSKNSPLKPRVDQALTRLQDNDLTRGLCARYLTPADTQYCII